LKRIQISELKEFKNLESLFKQECTRGESRLCVRVLLDFIDRFDELGSLEVLLENEK
jgi:hypothetical protein